MPTDRELLRQYVEEGAEAAFAELVRRHVGVVYSAAARMTGGDTALAEDVAQAVFIALAQRAKSLVPHETLIGWLHTSTRYVTLRALRDRRRRQAREQKALAMATNTPENIPWEQVRPLLDEAVGSLNEADRQAVLLRYFEGCSHREVGAALGVAEDAARVRIERAVEKLRRHFARRGIAAGAALLGEIISAHAAEAPSAGLAARVAQGVAAAPVRPAPGWGGLVVRILLMTTKQKALVAVLLMLMACLFTLSIPGWSRSPGSENSTAQNGALKGAPASKVAEAGVQPPVVSPAKPADAKTVVAPTVAAATAPSQTAPTPPPPPLLRGGRGASFGTGGNGFRNQYRSLFSKLHFSAEQQKAFLDALTAQQEKTSDLEKTARAKYTTAQYDALLTDAANKVMQPMPAGITPDQAAARVEAAFDDALGITDQRKAINDATDAQLRQILGTEENYQAYLTYNSQQGVRNWVTSALGYALQNAGVDALTPDQQEAMVGIIAKSIQPGDPPMRIGHLDEVMDKAKTVLTPEQIDILQTNPIGAGLSYGKLHPAP